MHISRLMSTLLNFAVKYAGKMGVSILYACLMAFFGIFLAKLLGSHLTGILSKCEDPVARGAIVYFIVIPFLPVYWEATSE